MCVILDADAASQSFGPHATEAGKRFLEYIAGGKLLLVVGGCLRFELAKCNDDFRRWMARVKVHHGIFNVEDDDVEQATEELVKGGRHESDDPHILALADLSGADLIFTNDKALQRDCKTVLGDVSVYTTNHGREKFTRRKRVQLDSSFCTQANAAI